MATRQYIGARYVPKFYQNSVDGSANWEANVVYQPLTYVTLTNGHMYISKKQVPATVGTPASNADYWLDVGSYNGFIEELQEQIDALTTQTALLQNNVNVINAKYPIVGTGIKADGTTDDSAALQALINYCITNKCALYIPAGTVLINSTVTISGGLEIFGDGAYSFSYNGITEFSGTKIKWGGANGGDMFVVTNGNISLNIHDIDFDGNSLAGRCMWVKSMQYSTFDTLSFHNATLTQLDLEAAGIIAWCVFDKLFVNAPLTSVGIKMGVDIANKQSNVCHNVFKILAVNHVNGNGILIGDCDNNLFLQTYCHTGTTTKSVVLANTNGVAPVGNVFMLLQAAGGLEQQSGVNYNLVYDYALDNGQPAPSATGTVLPIIGNTYGAITGIGSLGNRFTSIGGNNFTFEVTMPSGGTWVEYTFPTAEPDNAYFVIIQPRGSAEGITFGAANPSTTKVDIYGSSAPSTDIILDCLLVRRR